MADLQAGHDDLIHGRVTLTKNAHHKKAQNEAEALVAVTMPGRQTLTARKEEKTFEEAIRAAFFAMAIEVKKFRDNRASKEIRVPPIPLRGVIGKLFLQEGYGFLLQDGGGEVYFHKNAVHGINLRNLRMGSRSRLRLKRERKVLRQPRSIPFPAFPDPSIKLPLPDLIWPEGPRFPTITFFPS